MIKFFKVLLKVIGWILVFIAVFGGLATFSRNFMEPFYYVAILLYLIPAWFCFWGSNKLAKAQNKRNKEASPEKPKSEIKADQAGEMPRRQPEPSCQFSKEELSQLISDCDRLAVLFQNSQVLQSTGNGRSVKMVQTMMSYKCIFIYLYSSLLRYGSPSDFLRNDTELAGRYAVSCSMVFNNPQARTNCFMLLSANWKDILQVLDSMTMAGEKANIQSCSSAIDALTKAFEKVPGCK